MLEVMKLTPILQYLHSQSIGNPKMMWIVEWYRA